MLRGLIRTIFLFLVLQSVVFFGYHLYYALHDLGLPVDSSVEHAATAVVHLHQDEARAVRDWVVDDDVPSAVRRDGALSDGVRAVRERLADLSLPAVSGDAVPRDVSLASVNTGAAGALLVGVAVLLIGFVIIRAFINDPVRKRRRELTQRFRAIDREHADMSERAVEFNRLFTSYMKRRN